MVYGYPTQQQNISYGALNTQNMQQPVNGVYPNGAYPQNFGAIDTEKLKQDAVELSNKAADEVKENWITRTLKNVFHIKNPKKFLISLGLTIGTVIGVSVLGNSKLSVHKMNELGRQFENSKIMKNSFTKGVSNFVKNGKNKFVNFLKKNDTIKNTMEDLSYTFKHNKAKPKADLTRGYGQGFLSIFSLTPVDIFKTKISKMDEQAGLELLKKLSGSEDAAKALKKTIFENPGNLTNKQLCKEMTDVISKNFGCKTKDDIYKILSQLESGKITGLDGKLNLDVSEFTTVIMNGEKTGKQGIIRKAIGLPGKAMGDWWLVNWIDKAGSTIMGSKWKPFCRGNLGNSLLKYNTVAGNLADTKIGALLQKSILVPCESIGNHTNDKSGLGVFLCGMIMSLYNNVQDAPKDKKVATIADDYIGTIGSIGIATPMAFGATYGLATLANQEGKTIFNRILKPIGKFFGMGLDPMKNGVAVVKKLPFNLDNKVLNALANAPTVLFRKAKGITGGGLRFVLIMMVFSTLFSKPIKNVIHKIFGKPYVPGEEEAEAQKQLQAQMQQQMEQQMKDLNLTEEQMIAKLQAHPEFIQTLQNNPQLMAQIQENPMLLLQMVASLPDEPYKPISAGVANGTKSELLQNYINNNQTQTSQNAVPNMQPAQQKDVIADRATYVPSSRPFGYNSAAHTATQNSAVQNNNVNLPPAADENQPVMIQEETITNENVKAVLAKADRAMDDALKFM